MEHAFGLPALTAAGRRRFRKVQTQPSETSAGFQSVFMALPDSVIHRLCVRLSRPPTRARPGAAVFFGFGLLDVVDERQIPAVIGLIRNRVFPWCRPKPEWRRSSPWTMPPSWPAFPRCDSSRPRSGAMDSAEGQFCAGSGRDIQAVRRLAGVIIRGQWMAPGELDRRLAKLER
jgi:hypothetical protein